MTARLAAAREAGRDGRGSPAPRSPKHRCQGSAVRRRSVGSPSPSSRVRDEQPASGRDDRPVHALRGNARANAARIARSNVETALVAAAGAGSPAHAGAGGFRAPSSAPICTTVRPAGPDGRAPGRRTTRPRQPPESAKAEAIDVDSCFPPGTEFLNPPRVPSQPL
jgi:hypothetical protein